MTRAVWMIVAGLLLFLAPGCASAYTVGSMSYPWGDIAPATSSGWVVIDNAGRPSKVVVVTKSREHVNPTCSWAQAWTSRPVARVSHE